MDVICSKCVWKSSCGWSAHSVASWESYLKAKYGMKFILSFYFLNVCPFDFTTVAGSGKVGPVNQVNNTRWVAVVTPTDRPKSVCNRCVIELFCDVTQVR